MNVLTAMRGTRWSLNMRSAIAYYGHPDIKHGLGMYRKSKRNQVTSYYCRVVLANLNYFCCMNVVSSIS